MNIRMIHILLGCLISVIATGTFMRYSMHRRQVHAYVGDTITITAKSKHIALLGCTPHPTQYLIRNGNRADCLRSICLNDFLDKKYVEDSFKRTLLICKNHSIDQLIIAYLPIYFNGLRTILGDQFLSGCTLFLQRIRPEIEDIINRTAKEVGYPGLIDLIIPTHHQLVRVPQKIVSFDDRVRYLIKQFPVLRGISGSEVATITIINNKESPEDDRLIDYLKYQYLFEKELMFAKKYIDKDRFHQ